MHNLKILPSTVPGTFDLQWSEAPAQQRHFEVALRLPNKQQAIRTVVEAESPDEALEIARERVPEKYAGTRLACHHIKEMEPVQ